MPELIRSIAARLRAVIGNRRLSPRLKAQLPVTVCIALRQTGAATRLSSRPAPSLSGRTRDISQTGLAVILPSILLGEHHLTGDGRTLLISLELPAGPINLRAVPARYERLEDEDGAAKLYLIGVRITEMTDEDRALFAEYLKSLQ